MVIGAGRHLGFGILVEFEGAKVDGGEIIKRKGARKRGMRERRRSRSERERETVSQRAASQ